MSDETNGLPLENEAADQEQNVPKSESGSSNLQEELGLTPKTIVLAKVKGYRAWPAMVLDEEILPENIKKLKPKSVKQQKKSSPTILVPVRFFSDDTYIWIRNHDLKILLDEEIQSFLDKHATAGKRKDELLVFAYELAKDPPDMQQFNLWGSRGQPEVSDSLEEEEEVEEPPQKKLKLKLSLKGSKDKSKKATKATKATKASKAKETKKTTTKSQAKAPAKKKATTKKTAPKEERYTSYEEYEKDLENANESDLEDDEYGSDWGLGESVYDFETGDYIFDNEKEQKHFVNEFPSSAQLQEDSAYYNEQFDNIFQKVAPTLLDGELKNENAIIKELRAAGKFAEEAPLAVFTKSPLYRCLLVAAHKPEEKLPFQKIKDAIKTLLKNFSLDTCELTMEDLVLPTPQETPNQTPGLTPGPENGIKEEAEVEEVRETPNPEASEDASNGQGNEEKAESVEAET
ncbi:hypothetical protein FT663_05289 [Candidozyma haemuli var. vulneris]|nr:hypothetical protein FT662_05321 [[Candida] haemuloni var. vulneris]KAF3985474.1 hypothetical protein FT663_05289 [[Candida] haemuloni var. vulneris]